MCVNSASTVLRGAGANNMGKAKQQARSSRVRQGVNKRLAVDALFLSKKPVYSTKGSVVFDPWFPCHVLTLAGNNLKVNSQV